MIPQAENISLRDAMLALGVVALWGLHIVVIRIGATEIPPFLLLTLRFSIVAAIGIFFLRKLSADKIKAIFLYTIFYMVLHLGTIFLGLKYTPSSIGGLILQTQVPFAILLGWFFFGERFGVKTFAGLLMAFIGVMIIIYQPAGSTAAQNFSYFGALTILASAFFWAVGSLRMRFIQDVGFIDMTLYSHLIALPFALLLTLVFESDHIEAIKAANPFTLGGVLAYQVILMSLCLFLWKGLMVRNKAYQVTSFSLLQPIFAVGFSILLLSEDIDAKTIIGGAVALCGVGVVTLRKIQKSEKPPARQGEL